MEVTNDHKRSWMLFWKYGGLQKFRESGFSIGPCMHLTEYVKAGPLAQSVLFDDDIEVGLVQHNYWFEERRYGNEYWIAVTLDDGRVLVPPMLCPNRDPRQIAVHPAEKARTAWYDYSL